MIGQIDHFGMGFTLIRKPLCSLSLLAGPVRKDWFFTHINVVHNFEAVKPTTLNVFEKHILYGLLNKQGHRFLAVEKLTRKAVTTGQIR